MLFRLIILLTALFLIYILYSFFKVKHFTFGDIKDYINKNIRQEPVWYRKSSNFAFLIVLICFVLLVLTGFGHVLIAGSPLSGPMLILHVTVAPVFVAGFTFILFLIVHGRRFNSEDWQNLKQAGINFHDCKLEKFWEKMHFWLFYVGVILAITSVMLMLFPLFGPEGQEMLLLIHRYSTLFLFLVSIHFFYIKKIRFDMEIKK